MGGVALGSPAEARLICEQDMREPELHRLAPGVAVAFSAARPDRERVNEDAAALIPIDGETVVLAVADGVGGQRAGAEAAGLALRTLRDSVGEAARRREALRDAILNGFESANRAIADAATGGATTLVVAEIQGATLRPYHAGDSAILVVGQRGKLKLQTVSHSPVAYAVEAGFLDEREALHHTARHLISNAIGVPDMRIEIGSGIELASRDTVVLASDGLFDNLHVPEIAELMRKGPLARGAEKLANACRERMSDPRQGQPSKPDDLTFIAFRRTPPRPH